MARKRAETRARYHIRDLAEKRGWRMDAPNRGGNCLEEQEIEDFFPGIGLGRKGPIFSSC